MMEMDAAFAIAPASAIFNARIQSSRLCGVRSSSRVLRATRPTSILPTMCATSSDTAAARGTKDEASDTTAEAAAAEEAKAEAESEEEEDTMMQGPSQAPTEAGVSTAGLTGAAASLLEASYKADVGAIEAALADGADVNTADVNGRTSLHFCAGNGLHTLVRDLVSRGATLNKQDVLGFTPLHMATGYKMVSTVRELVELGADANVASYDGRLAVEIAEAVFENTPKRTRFFMENSEYAKMEEIVQVLDEATEVEEGDEDDEMDEKEGDGTEQSKDFLNDAGESVEVAGDTKFVVRVKAPAPAPASAPQETALVEAEAPKVEADDGVKVTIRIKEPKAKQ